VQYVAKGQEPTIGKVQKNSQFVIEQFALLHSSYIMTCGYHSLVQIGMSYRKILGDWGESHAVQLLAAADFNGINPLNIGFQHPGGDVLARKNGILHFFSVKARDRFGQNGKPNPGYNIYPEKVIKAARAYKAKPSWLFARIGATIPCVRIGV
jgi:hypothetical protein